MTRTPNFGDDDGMGLVEIMVAMLLFAVLMLGLIPILVHGLASTSKSASITSAARVANASVEEARSLPAASCDEFKQMVVDSLATTATDGRGTLLVEHTSTCATKDKTAVYQVKVTLGTKTLADIKTEIWLHG